MTELRTVLVSFLVFVSIALSAQSSRVMVLDLDSPVFAATAQYINNGIREAKAQDVSLIILKINTPGGLLKSTRDIVGSIMESDIPVVSYVTPAGAHAGSAGAFIALAADISAMSPGTNIGASHPVSAVGSVDSIMNDKITEDASAFIRSIAEKRGKNPELIMEMVNNSRSFTAREAHQQGIIDILANNTQDLLSQVNNFVLHEGTEREQRFSVAGAESIHFKMNAMERFMNKLNDPNIMYLLLLLGVMGILFEVFNPGGIFPGVIGVISLILSGYGMSLLPVDYTGLFLIILGIVLFILEIKFQSYGILSIGGVISLFLGSIFLIKTEPSFDVVDISWTVLISSVILTAIFFIFLLGLGVKALKGKTKTGSTGMVGKTAKVITDLNPVGKVRVMGEIWDAHSIAGEVPAGMEVEITEIDDLKLYVKPID